jgi:hypothetical protein
MALCCGYGYIITHVCKGQVFLLLAAIMSKISKAAYDRYLEDENFHKLLWEKNLGKINSDVLEVLRIFKERALEGSYNHGKALLELAGYYKNKGQEEKKDEDIVLVSHIPRPDQEDKKSD